MPADTTANAQLCSESFDGSQGDLFALQEMVTARIGNGIGREIVIITARESEARNDDPKVSDPLLRAEALILQPNSRRNMEERRSLNRQALTLEPNNARAMVGLAASLSSLALNGYSDPTTDLISDIVQPPAVIPAKVPPRTRYGAGIHSLESRALGEMSTALTQWIPACAGMTTFCVVPVAQHLLAELCR